LENKFGEAMYFILESNNVKGCQINVGEGIQREAEEESIVVVVVVVELVSFFSTRQGHWSLFLEQFESLTPVQEVSR